MEDFLAVTPYEVEVLTLLVEREFVNIRLMEKMDGKSSTGYRWNVDEIHYMLTSDTSPYVNFINIDGKHTKCLKLSVAQLVILSIMIDDVMEDFDETPQVLADLKEKIQELQKLKCP